MFTKYLEVIRNKKNITSFDIKLILLEKYQLSKTVYLSPKMDELKNKENPFPILCFLKRRTVI